MLSTHSAEGSPSVWRCPPRLLDLVRTAASSLRSTWCPSRAPPRATRASPYPLRGRSAMSSPWPGPTTLSAAPARQRTPTRSNVIMLQCVLSERQQQRQRHRMFVCVVSWRHTNRSEMCVTRFALAYCRGHLDAELYQNRIADEVWMKHC
jgi:hypothetical protein